MTTYVLIAGAWHGSWCWSEVRPLLEASGHRVLTPDLFGMSDSVAAPVEQPIAAWAEQVANILRVEADPVVLVGHSRAGLVISEVAERVPEKVGVLIYLCAFLLQDGQTLQQIAEQADNAAVFARATVVHDDGTASIDKGAVRRLFYNETPETLAQLASQRLVPEPLSSFVTPIHVTEPRFGSVHRAYIECVRDGAIPIGTQRAMQAALPCAHLMTLHSDHSPFLSMPANLAKALEQIVSEVKMLV